MCRRGKMCTNCRPVASFSVAAYIFPVITGAHSLRNDPDKPSLIEKNKEKNKMRERKIICKTQYCTRVLFFFNC